MNQEQLKGNWQKIKGKIQQQWGKLTEDDLSQGQGDFDSLVGKLAERYGFAKEVASEKLNAFLKKINGDDPDSMKEKVSAFAAETAQDWKQCAQKNPGFTVGAATIGGVILGLLLGKIIG